MLPRSCGPMGLINSTVADVLTFARLHLDDGGTDDGTQLVSAEGIARDAASRRSRVPIRTRSARTGDSASSSSTGTGSAVYGHDGGTIGQSSRLRIVPDADLAITLVANGGDTQLVYQELFGELMAELAGIAMPAAAGGCRPTARRRPGRASPAPTSVCRSATT